MKLHVGVVVEEAMVVMAEVGVDIEAVEGTTREVADTVVGNLVEAKTVPMEVDQDESPDQIPGGLFAIMEGSWNAIRDSPIQTMYGLTSLHMIRNA